MHTYSDPNKQALVDAAAKNMYKAQSIIDGMRGVVTRLSVKVDKDITLTAAQMQRIAENQGKIVYAGAHPKRTS